MEEKILKALEEIKPALISDGGDIEFIKYEDKTVFVKLLGGCAHCPHRNETIKNYIFTFLKSQIPEIENIINVEI